jgi:DNA adenine methylase
MGRLTALIYHLGSKHRLAPWILSHIPSQLQTEAPFYDVYGGGGSVLLSKPPSQSFEVWNDLNPNTHHFFSILKAFPYDLEKTIYEIDFKAPLFQVTDDDLYRAAVFFFLARTSFRGAGTAWDSQTSPSKLGLFLRKHRDRSFDLVSYSNRLQQVAILNMDAIELIEQSDSKAVLYCDPPYPHSVRNGKDSRHKDQENCLSRNQYAFDYTKDDHSNLLSICLIKGKTQPILLSSYQNPQYDEYLLSSGWKLSTQRTRDLASNSREEALYLSPGLVDLWRSAK